MKQVMTSNFDYPVLFLPSGIQSAVTEVQNLIQAPIGLVATSAIASIAVACQGLLDVRAPTGSVTPTSLFFLSVANSGERKSSTDKLFSQPIIDFQQEQECLHRDKMPDYEGALAVWKIELKNLQSQIKRAIKKESSNKEELQAKLQILLKRQPKRPSAVKIAYTDTTIEALLYGLHSQWPYAALTSTDASTMLGSLSMNQLAHLNTLWDGDQVAIDRKSLESFTLHDVRLSTSLMIQPEPLQQFLKRQNEYARQSGFLARMLVANPPSTQGERFNVCNISTRENIHLLAFQTRLSEILAKTLTASKHNRVVLEFSQPAQQIWYDFYAQGESSLRPFQSGENIKDAVSKLPNNMARMAALFHFFAGKEGLIDQESALAAYHVCNWHIKEFERLFTPKDDVTITNELAELLYQWLWRRYQNHGGYQCRKKDIYTHGPNRLRKCSILNPVIDQLVCEGKIFHFPLNKPAFVELNLNYGMPQQIVVPPPTFRPSPVM